MKYEEVLDYLEINVNKLGSVMGLVTIRELLRRMGNPQETLQFIHVAGTNGKGSVSTFLAEGLMANGYKIGRYISPVITDYREKIQVNNKHVTKTFVADCLTELFRISKEMEAEGFAHPTAFELETAMAFAYFRDKKCDYVVLECGMGGAEDATNVIPSPKLCVFTEISMDHEAILGDTPEKIAMVKSGILKPGTAMVSAKQTEEVAQVLAKACGNLGITPHFADPLSAKKIKSTLKSEQFSYDVYQNVKIPLLGAHQRENAILALLAFRVLKELGVALKDDKILAGFMNAKWPGRFEILGKKPYILADGAHNEAAVKKLMETLRFHFTNQRIVYIMGVLKDKDYSCMIQDSCDMAEYIVTVTPPIRHRALPAFELAGEIRKYHPNVTAADSIEEALEMATLLAGPEGVVLAFGSLSYLGAFRTACENRERNKGGIK